MSNKEMRKTVNGWTDEQIFNAQVYLLATYATQSERDKLLKRSGIVFIVLYHIILFKAEFRRRKENL